ncbi:MAG: hypothetical protein LBU32_21295 [Clostridiales bacterium]|jgi:hypothetical protein|nr:hypothetical protein [Clostridiales bacterium]
MFANQDWRELAMTRQELIDYCLTFPAAYEEQLLVDFAKSPDSWTVMRHGGNKSRLH